MEETKTPLFMLVTGESDVPGIRKEMLVNLSQIRVVDQITDDTARLVFSESFMLVMHGRETVMELLAFLAKNAVTHGGKTLIEAFGLSESKPPSSASSEDPPREA